MTMDDVLLVVQCIGFLQLAVVIVSIFLFYLLRAFFKSNDRYLNKKTEDIKRSLNSLIKDEIKLTSKLLQWFKKNVRELLACMEQLEVSPSLLPRWIDIRDQLSNNVLKPHARRLAKSSKRLNQYFAILCYEYGINDEDEQVLCELVQSDIAIVSLNTARVIFKYPSYKTITALIDSLAQGRRIQQSLYTEVLLSESIRTNEMIIKTFTDRLTSEPDPYIRIFCYRMLKLLSPPKKVLEAIKIDIVSQNLDLKIASLEYLSVVQTKDSCDNLRQCLNDTAPEVRAIVAKLLGEINDKHSIPLLEEKLHDPGWWVRINAAQALSKLGKNGILALQQQSPEVDKFAYETAQKVLITLAP